MKKLTLIILILLMLIGTLPLTASAGNSFTDVSVSDYFSNAVDWGVAKQIVKGTSDTTFSPNDTCTQAQIITMIWRSYGCPAPTQIHEIYNVNESDYYYTAALWAREKGAFINAYFKPNEPCTRATAVWYLWNTQGKPYIPNTAQLRTTDFTDITSKVCRNYSLEDKGHCANSGTFINGVDYSNYYFVLALNWATKKGITNGTSTTTFSPFDTCTRAQIIAMLYRDGNSSELCANGNHTFVLLNGDDKYLKVAPTCSVTEASYYKSCITCGLSSKDIEDTWGYDIMTFYSHTPKHSYKLCVEPTTERYGLKYCTTCGKQAHIAKISNHVHDWQRITSSKLLFDRLRGDTTLLEYIWYFEDQYDSNRSPHITIFEEGLKTMDEDGKYYYKNGQKAGLIDDDYIIDMYLSGSYEAGLYYKCKICGERQIEETLEDLYGEDAIFGTYDTIYNK